MKILVLVGFAATITLLAAFIPHSPRPVQLAPQQTISDNFGTVIGSVVDADSKPVPGARVSSTNLGAAPSGRRFFALSDKDGKFVLRYVTPGRNEIHAFKSSAGYPDTSFAFFLTQQQEIPQVVVKAKQVVEGVIIQLGPKAGILRGKLLDSATNRPLKEAQVTLIREDDPQLYYSFSYIPDKGKDYFELPVPPVAFRIKVSAPNYVSAKGGENEIFLSVTPVESNKIKEITVRLRRAN